MQSLIDMVSSHYLRPRFTSRRAFSLFEMMIYMVIMGTIGLMALPKVNRTTRQQRVLAATAALGADVDAAFSLTARLRRPVRITYDGPSGEIRFADRASGVIYRRRALGSTSEFKLTNVVVSPSTVDLFPGGTASAAFMITLTNGASLRRLNVSRTGLTRITIP